MDIGLFRGLITLAVFVLFLGIVFWSYSRKRTVDFNEAANLPLQEDPETLDSNEVNR